MSEALDIASTYGVGYLASVISAALFGVTCIQAFYYFRSYAVSKDSWLVKGLVILLTLLDIGHQIIVTDVLWYYLIANYASPAALLRNIPGEEIEILFNAVIAVLVEYAWTMRLWILSKNPYITCLCGVLATVHFALDVSVPALGWTTPSLAVAAVKFRKVGLAAEAISCATIITITMSLCYYLWINRTGVGRSGDIINKLMMMVVASGMLTTITVIAETATFVALPNDLWEFFFGVLSCKCYINAYLTSLNAREAIRGHEQEKADFSFASMDFRSHGQTTESNTISVVVHSETGQDDVSTRHGSSPVQKVVQFGDEV